MLLWTEGLELGIDLIDNQHREIFEQINKLILSFDEGTEQESAYDVLCFIEDYVNKHFTTEEFYLQKYEYQDLANHIQMHRAFSKHLDDYKVSHRRSGMTRHAAIEMNEFLTSWWQNHILKIDSKYVEEIGEKII